MSFCKKFTFLGLFLLTFAVHIAGSATSPSGDPFQILRKNVGPVFGDQRRPLWSNDTLVRKAILEAVGIPDDPLAQGSFTFVSGCRIHSCQEKGASIIDMKRQRLEATSLLHFACVLEIIPKAEILEIVKKKLSPVRNKCAASPMLSIFVIRRGNEVASLLNENDHVETLRAWGEKNGASTVEVHVVTSR